MNCSYWFSEAGKPISIFSKKWWNTGGLCYLLFASFVKYIIYNIYYQIAYPWLTALLVCITITISLAIYLFFFIGSYLIQDRPQMSFATLYGLFPWSQNPLTLLFLTENIKMDSILTKINWKICASFTLYFKFWRHFS